MKEASFQSKYIYFLREIRHALLKAFLWSMPQRLSVETLATPCLANLSQLAMVEQYRQKVTFDSGQNPRSL
jgi:hypothetical protein